MEYFFDHINIFGPVVLLLMISLVYAMKISTTKRQIGWIIKSLNDKKEYQTSPEKTYLISSPFSSQTRCMNVYKGEFILSHIDESRQPFHRILSPSEVSEINFWHGYAEIIPDGKVPKTRTFLAKATGETFFNTFNLQMATNIGGLAPILRGNSLTSQLKAEFEAEGFVVTSHKPYHPITNAVLVIIVIIVGILAIAITRMPV